MRACASKERSGRGIPSGDPATQENQKSPASDPAKKRDRGAQDEASGRQIEEHERTFSDRWEW